MDENKNEIKNVLNEPENSKIKWGYREKRSLSIIQTQSDLISTEVSSYPIAYNLLFLSLIGIYNLISNWYQRVRSRLSNSIFNVFNRTKKEVKNSDEREPLPIKADCLSSQGETSSDEESSIVLRNSLADFSTNFASDISALQEVPTNGTESDTSAPLEVLANGTESDILDPQEFLANGTESDILDPQEFLAHVAKSHILDLREFLAHVTKSRISDPQEVLANRTDLENLFEIFEMIEGPKNVIHTVNLLHHSGGICIETEAEAPTLPINVGEGFQSYVESLLS